MNQNQKIYQNQNHKVNKNQNQNQNQNHKVNQESESESENISESESESENGNISFEFSDFWKKKIARAIKKDIKNGFIFDDYIENKNEENFDKVRSFCD